MEENTRKAYMKRLFSQNYVNKETISHFLWKKKFLLSTGKWEKTKIILNLKLGSRKILIITKKQ